jgi:hypothetical protein
MMGTGDPQKAPEQGRSLIKCPSILLNEDLLISTGQGVRTCNPSHVGSGHRKSSWLEDSPPSVLRHPLRTGFQSSCL